MKKMGLLFISAFLTTTVFAAPAYAKWACVKGTVPDALNEYRCVQGATPESGALDYETLRNCLKCQDNVNLPEKPYIDSANITQACSSTQSGGNMGTDQNACKEDPRYVMRNFPPLDYWDVSRALNLIIPLTTIIGAVIAGGFLMYGAYMYTTAQGDSKKIADAMHTITWAAAGLVFVVIAYTLVRTILFITKTNNFGF